MKKKLFYLFFVILIFFNFLRLKCNNFCGPYIGANFNFGVITYSVNSDHERSHKQLGRNILDTSKRRNRASFNRLWGGGITIGYNYIYNCYIIGPEFNSFFYLNPSCIESQSEKTTIKCTSESTITDSSLLKVKRKNNIRLDGILKMGYLTSDHSFTYLLGGVSGINLQKYSTPIRIKKQNFQIKKWLAGGVIGIGNKLLLNECLDVFIEIRYSKYQEWSYGFQGFTDKHKSKNKPQSLLGLFGLNFYF